MLIFAGVAQQRVGEGWQQVLEVAVDRGNHPADNKRRGVFKHPDKLVGQFHGLDRDAFFRVAIGQQKYGQVLVALTDGAQQFQRLGMRGIVVLAQGPVDAHAVQGGIGHHGRQGVIKRDGLDQLSIALGELLDQFVQHTATHAAGVA